MIEERLFMTHWVGCWRSHHDCAVKRLEEAIGLLTYAGAASGEHDEDVAKFIAWTVPATDRGFTSDIQERDA